MTAPQEMPIFPPRPFGMNRADVAYTFCAATFGVVLVLTNIVGVKLFELFPGGGPSWLNGGEPLALTSGIVTYPLTFLLTDVVSEIWGRRRADLMVVLGFVMSLMMLGVVKLVGALPPSDVWQNETLGLESAAMQDAYTATFYYPGTLLFASMLAYLVAQLFDVRLYHFWRALTKGRHLWLRNNGSTWISQLVDTIIVNTIFLHWGLGFGWGLVFQIIVANYLLKLVLAALDTPLIYLLCHALKRWIGIPDEGWTAEAPLE